MLSAPSDMAVIVAYFNHHNFKAPLRNLRRFCRLMAQTNVALYGMELCVPGGRSEISGLYGNWTSVRSNNRTMLWQKEAMWNQLARELPPQFTKVMGCDTDLWFDNPQFLNQTSAALDTHRVVMPYSRAVWTDARGAEERSRDDAATAHLKSGKYWEGHQGFATAFQRSFWDQKIELYPYGVLGAGDTFLWSALTGTVNSTAFLTKALGGEEMLKAFNEWATRVQTWCGGSMASVPGTVFHEYHGTRENRQLVSRHDRLAGLRLRDMAVRADGLLSWTDQAPMELMNGVYEYFRQRKDDE